MQLHKYPYNLTDGDGTISPQELTSVMRNFGQNPSDAELKAIMKDMDSNNDGNIDFNEFLCLMAARSKVPALDSEDELREAFKVFDRDGSGLINLEELKAVMKRLGIRLTDEEYDIMMKEADQDGNGVVDFNGTSLFEILPPRVLIAQWSRIPACMCPSSGMSEAP